MDKMITFSVVIPTHNRDDLLAKAVSSALDQKLSPIQVIVVNDVPNRSTRLKVDKLAETKISEILYIENNDIKGALGSRNLGVKYAQGEYLAFLDDDDLWSDQYLLRAAEEIKTHDLDLVLSKVIGVNGEMERYVEKAPPDEYSEEDYYLSNPGALCSNLIVKADQFRRIGGYDTKILGSADKDLFMQLKRLNCKHKVLHDDLVFWRTGHADQW